MLKLAYIENRLPSLPLSLDLKPLLFDLLALKVALRVFLAFLERVSLRFEIETKRNESV